MSADRVKPFSNPARCSDGGGLHLFITKAGRKSLRITFNGCRRDIGLRRHPSFSQARGREEATDYRDALKRRRCLVLADGYFEWQKTPVGKKPYRIIMKSGESFAMAGLWETWRDPLGNTVPSCTIITTAANDFLAPIHNRMPVILSRESDGMWLD